MITGLVVLVGCGATKLDRAAPARELYTGQLFTKARAWAERNAEQWFVVSALHGLIEPEKITEPYDYRLGSAKSDAFRLGQRVGWQLATALPDAPRRLVILAGRSYVDPIRERLRGFQGWPQVEDPLAGMGIGRRLAWLGSDS